MVRTADKQLELYIQRLYKIQEERKQQLDQKDLLSAAEAVGLTEFEMKEIEERSQNHLKRAESFVGVERWIEAEEEIKQALELNYLRVEFLFAAADFYLKKYKATRIPASLNSADNYARKCLDFIPDFKPAQDILATTSFLLKKRRQTKRIKIALGFTIAPFLLLTIWMLINEAFIQRWPTGLEGEAYTVPIVLGEHPDIDGVGIQFSDGIIQHENISGSRSFNLNFHCVVSSNKFELTELGFQAIFLDKNGEQLADSYYWFWTEGTMSLRPNENYYYRDDSKWAGNYFNISPDRIAKIEMRLQGFQKYSGAFGYPESKLQPVEWIAARDSRHGLEVRQRKNLVTVTNNTDRSTVQQLLLELKNTGEKDIRALSLAFEWYDNKGILIEQQIGTILKQDEPVFFPKQTLVYFLDKQFSENPWGFPKPFDSLKIKVKSVQ